MLKEFLVQFNTRFEVPAQHPEAAYRMLEPGVCLDTVLCFRHSRKVARDNTVKYRWRTLQLLPGTERRSYAGAVVEVLEGLDGRLAVRYRGEIIPSQEAPPRPGRLRSLTGPSSNGSAQHGGLNGLGRRWEVPWQHSTRRWTPPMLATRSSTTALSESASHLPCNAGSPRHFRRQDGRLCRRRSAGGCRFEASPGKWASTGTLRRSTWRPRVHPCTQIGSSRGHLLTSRVTPVTFMLAT